MMQERMEINSEFVYFVIMPRITLPPVGIDLERHVIDTYCM